MKKLTLTSLVMLSLLSCKTSEKTGGHPNPNATGVSEKADGKTGELRKGSSLYIQRCSGCHRLHDPGEFTRDQWEKTLQVMFPKAHVDEQKDGLLIRQYLYKYSRQ